MLNLNDPKWKQFEGGYRMPYDASVPLRKLENTNDRATIESILTELWGELHHQGDVGIASYLSVPHLIKITKENQLYDTSIIRLITVIEIQRHKNNPPLPLEYQSDYLASIKELADLALMAIKKEWDLEIASSVLSAVAVSKGQITLANAILNMDSEDVIEEFLESY